MKTFNLSDYSVIFLSFDEPNADQNYNQLLKIVPYAKRIHGIEGSDAAHKACAMASDTERLIIVDGDNFVYSSLPNQTIFVEKDLNEEDIVFGWPSYNVINGLTYGNGSIKCWNKNAILKMKTHENAVQDDEKSQVEFCWNLNFIPLDRCLSSTVNNASKLQAFRAGFREGVKLSLINGKRPFDIDQIELSNLRRLKTWLTIGAEVQNGIWAILGAWYGFYKTNFTDWNFVEVRNFNFLNDFYNEHIKNISEVMAMSIISKFIFKVKQLKPDFIITTPFDAEKSIFYKSLNNNPTRQPDYVKCASNKNDRYDIFMITYDEPDCDKNYDDLKQRFPYAKRIHGVEGIQNAHKQAAELASTEMFWVVDGDAKILENFKFDYLVDEEYLDFVHVWRSKNPINDLIYGYGGVKLLPKHLTKNMDTSKPDMTTSISSKFKIVNEIANITNFNVSEFHTWRSAFRECCKLASKVIDRQNDAETVLRLEKWCTVGLNRPFGKYSIDGAIAGKTFGELHRGNLETLKKINDFNWLKEKFNEQYF